MRLGARPSLQGHTWGRAEGITEGRGRRRRQRSPDVYRTRETLRSSLSPLPASPFPNVFPENSLQLVGVNGIQGVTQVTVTSCCRYTTKRTRWPAQEAVSPLLNPRSKQMLGSQGLGADTSGCRRKVHKYLLAKPRSEGAFGVPHELH